MTAHYFPHTIPHFNSHAHEGRDLYGGYIFPRRSHFNSHAHEGRDPKTSLQRYCAEISTHTPTRGVTMYSCD